MREVLSAPNASMLMESTRSVGYSFESAVADIVDNSISAHAKTIVLESVPSDDPYLAVLDDGDGMTAERLQEAMRYGSDPNKERAGDDLGRFGLGMKMASLSQCRILTVASKMGNQISICRWNLDRVIETNEWTLQMLDIEEALKMPLLDKLLDYPSGTIVLWQKLDRLLNGTSSKTADDIAEALDTARMHLALTFHRFMTDEPEVSRVDFIFNGTRIEPLDPFLSRHPSTQRLPEQTIRVEGQEIIIKPFILPPLSKMTAGDKKLLGDFKNLRRLQGFYVYRNKRLIVPGTWFKLTESKELRNLARVRVDIPNTLDFLWDIDIKKSSATLPVQLRSSFVQFLDGIVERSERVHSHKGWKTTRGRTGIWDRIDLRGEYRYVINRNHPCVRLVASTSHDAEKRVEELLSYIESSLPLRAIYADLGSGNQIEPRPGDLDPDKVLESMRAMIRLGSTPEELRTTIPFCDYPELIDKLESSFDDGSVGKKKQQEC